MRKCERCGADVPDFLRFLCAPCVRKKWREANAEKQRVYVKKWRAANPDRVAVYESKRAKPEPTAEQLDRGRREEAFVAGRPFQKSCTACHRNLDSKMFNKCGRSLDGRSGRCKPCSKRVKLKAYRDQTRTAREARLEREYEACKPPLKDS